jgi:hypothetical protein
MRTFVLIIIIIGKCAFSYSLPIAIDYVPVFQLGTVQNFTELFALVPYTSNYIFQEHGVN